MPWPSFVNAVLAERHYSREGFQQELKQRYRDALFAACWRPIVRVMTTVPEDRLYWNKGTWWKIVKGKQRPRVDLFFEMITLQLRRDLGELGVPGHRRAMQTAFSSILEGIRRNELKESGSIPNLDPEQALILHRCFYQGDLHSYVAPLCPADTRAGVRLQTDAGKALVAKLTFILSHRHGVSEQGRRELLETISDTLVRWARPFALFMECGLPEDFPEPLVLMERWSTDSEAEHGAR